MRFRWEPYQEAHEGLVDAWLDDAAVRFTGIEGGWKAFHDYWMQDARVHSGCRDYCYIVFEGETPCCVLYAATQGEKLTVSACVVAPGMRGRGYGTAVLRELVDHCGELAGDHIRVAEAVIFPENAASQRAFGKAGFTFVSAHPAGDAWYYAHPIRIGQADA